MSESNFEDAYALDVAAPGVYTRTLGREWWGWNGQFGGYPLGLALQAGRMHVGDPAFRERSLTMHFLRRVPEGDMRIEMVTERAGRTTQNLSMRMFVADKLVTTAMMLFATDRDAQTLEPLDVPNLVPPADDEAPGEHPIPVPAVENFDIWPRHRGELHSGEQVSTGGGWMRLHEPGDGADERLGLLLADGYPPVSIIRATDPAVGGTMDFTAHFQRPFPHEVVSGHRPVLIQLLTRQSFSGYTDEDAEIWAPSGELLMRTHQVRYSERVDVDQFPEWLNREG